MRRGSTIFPVLFYKANRSWRKGRSFASVKKKSHLSMFGILSSAQPHVHFCSHPEPCFSAAPCLLFLSRGWHHQNVPTALAPVMPGLLMTSPACHCGTPWLLQPSLLLHSCLCQALLYVLTWPLLHHSLPYPVPLSKPCSPDVSGSVIRSPRHQNLPCPGSATSGCNWICSRLLPLPSVAGSGVA